MDVRTDDFIAEVMVRSENSLEVKCIELFAHSFIVHDETGEVRFANDEVRADLVAQIERGIFLAAHCELTLVSEGETAPSQSG